MEWNPAYLYLAVNLFAISYPIAQSFERRITLYRKWKALFPAILATGAVFIAWDVAFTDMGIWGFNDKYLTGIHLGNLPIEECLFFLTIPYACVFVYEVVNYFIPRDIFGPIRREIGIALLLGSVAMAIIFYDRWYTMTAYGFLAIMLAINLFWLKSRWLGRFFLAYLFCLLPFLVVNGILTGSWIEGEVVWYNDAENLGFRVGTIPFEDIFYGMGLILMNITIFERLLKRWSPKLVATAFA